MSPLTGSAHGFYLLSKLRWSSTSLPKTGKPEDIFVERRVVYWSGHTGVLLHVTSNSLPVSLIGVLPISGATPWSACYY